MCVPGCHKAKDILSVNHKLFGWNEAGKKKPTVYIQFRFASFLGQSHPLGGCLWLKLPLKSLDNGLYSTLLSVVVSQIYFCITNQPSILFHCETKKKTDWKRMCYSINLTAVLHFQINSFVLHDEVIVCSLLLPEARENKTPTGTW